MLPEQLFFRPLRTTHFVVTFVDAVFRVLFLVRRDAVVLLALVERAVRDVLLAFTGFLPAATEADFFVTEAVDFFLLLLLLTLFFFFRSLPLA